MKKSVVLFGVLLLSASCVELNGSLQVREGFNVKRKSGFLNLKTKIQRVEPGIYRAELTSKSSKKLELELRGGSLGKIDIPIKSDERLDIPSNGKFFIEGSKIGQPFNVSGVIRTEVDQYGYTDALEKCERSIVERHCEKVCHKKSQECDVVCKDVTITIEGLKEVSFHFKRTDRMVNLEFSPDNSTAVVAVLPVTGTETLKIIDREGICR